MSESETDLIFRIQGISCGVVVHTINIKVGEKNEIKRISAITVIQESWFTVIIFDMYRVYSVSIVLADVQYFVRYSFLPGPNCFVCL